jgi:hypothetical protein
MKCNKGWHLRWFYIKNYDAAPLPPFTGRTIAAAPPVWLWGLWTRRRRGSPCSWRHSTPKGPWPLRHWRHWGLPFKAGGAADGACPSAVRDGAGSAAGGHTLAQGLLQNLEIQQCIWDALEEPNATFPVEGH